MEMSAFYPGSAAMGPSLAAATSPSVAAAASGSLSQAASGSASVSGDGSLAAWLAALVILALVLLSVGRG